MAEKNISAGILKLLKLKRREDEDEDEDEAIDPRQGVMGPSDVFMEPSDAFMLVPKRRWLKEAMVPAGRMT